MSNASAAASSSSCGQDCPICLEPMSEGDCRYLLLCPDQCGFNMCMNCVEHLVASAKDDYQEASDGNRHVKIKLQCPQCRGDLRHTIQDTLLLRKALVASKYTDIPDSELTASELVIKHEFVEKYAMDVEHAEARLRKFQRDHGETESKETINLARSASSEQSEGKPFIDTTLCGGLEYAMSEAEQAYLTRMLTSGDSDQLAQAAQMLHGVMEISITGMTPSMKAAIKEPTSRSDRLAERKELEALQAFRKRHPLPARMPKYVVLKPFPTKNQTLVFQNDEWDGTIADAFARVQQTNKHNPGVDKILSLAEDPVCGTPKPRVKIKSVKGEAGRVGLQKGDVVTHVNGEPFLGTAEELSEMMDMLYENHPEETVQFVVNAEESTAEALRLRGLTAKEAILGV